MKKRLLCFALSLTTFTLFAQDTTLLWENSIGGTTDDYGYYIEPTADGGYITIGSATSGDGDLSTNFGDYDVLLTKLNAAGTIQWVKNLGGTLLEEGYTVHQTVDGGYFITGYTESSDGQITLNHGLKDIWIVKTNALGTIQWQKSIGGTSDERAYYTKQTADGGYIFAGYTESNDGDVTLNHGGADVWIVKMDTTGGIQWQKSYGGIGNDYGYFISPTPDGGYVITAYTDSNDGDALAGGYHGGGADVWILKITATGTLQWQKCYGGSSAQYGTAAYPTVDGGYIFSAYTASNDGDVSGSHGDFENWLVKTNATGTIQWQKCYGGLSSDANYSFIKTLDGKFVLAGYTYSSDGDVVGQHGGGEADYWIMQTDSAGTLEWQKCLGGTGDDEAFFIAQNTDSSFVITGLSNSIDGDVTGNAGTYDCWVAYLGPTPIVTGTTVLTTLPIQTVVPYPNPSTGEVVLKNVTVNDRIELFNVTGARILQTTATHSNEKINLSDQADGIYFYKVTRENGQVTSGKISKH